MNGLGGIGKTTLAEAYIFKYYDTYKHIVWITQNNKNLPDDFVQNTELIKKLNIDIQGKDPKTIFNEIVGSLRGFNKKPNLLIIDNALSSIEQYLLLLPGQPNWHLLLTSREKIAGLYEKPLGFLSPEEAVALFKKHCSRITAEEEIATLVASIGFHTLTIEILAKTAQRQRSDIQALKKPSKPTYKPI